MLKTPARLSSHCVAVHLAEVDSEGGFQLKVGSRISPCQGGLLKRSEGARQNLSEVPFLINFLRL